jgi:hypothetical protein
MCKNTATNGKIQIYEALKYYLFLPDGDEKTPVVYRGSICYNIVKIYLLLSVILV